MASTPRRVPMPQRGGGGNSSTRRAVAHPGTGGGTDPASYFRSPYQPPAGLGDLAGDIALADPNAWQVVYAGGHAWRVRPARPAALLILSKVANAANTVARNAAVYEFLIGQLHPDDFHSLLFRMTMPDDPFDAQAFTDLYRAAVTVGTARPFEPSSVSWGLPLIAGGSFGPRWHSPVSRTPSVTCLACTRYSTS